MKGAARSPTRDGGRRASGRDLKVLRRLAGYPGSRTAGGSRRAHRRLVLARLAVLSLGSVPRYLVDKRLRRRARPRRSTTRSRPCSSSSDPRRRHLRRSYLVAWIGERVVADLRRDVYAQVIRLSPGFFEVTRTGEVLSRLTTDTSVIQTVIGSSVTQALRNLLLLVGGLALLLVTNPKLTAMALVVVPLVVVPLVVVGRRVRGLSRAAQDTTAEVSAVAEETLNAVRTVQAFAQEEREVARFTAGTDAAFAAAARHALVRAVLAAVVITLVFGAIILVLWVGGRDVLAGPAQPRRALLVRVLRRHRGQRRGWPERGVRRPPARRRRHRSASSSC
jgi:ATP-binding cassette subfamily B protein